MKKFISILLCICLVLTAMTGCTQKASEPKGNEGEKPSEDKKDNQMVVAIPGLPDNGDCQNTSSAYNRIGLTQQVYDYLMKKDGDGNTVPNIIESYEFADDASSCTMTLMKGIKFWDGTEMTSNDVKYTIDRAKTSTGSIKGYSADIDHVEVIDDYTFKFIMGNPNVALLEYLTTIPIMCAAFTEAAGKDYGTDVDKIMGSGPYKMTEWKFGEYIVYEAFEDYILGAPKVKSIMLKVISDNNAAVIALQTGEIDLYMNDIPFMSVTDVEANKDLMIEYYSSSRYNYVLFNAEKGMFADERMRQAVAYAVNRDDMLIMGCEDLNNGYLVNSPAGPDFIANPGNEEYPYTQDFEKATQLVKDAGNYGKDVVLYTLAVEPYPKLATKLQDFLTKIGLKGEVVQMENSAYVDKICGNGDFEIAVCFNNFPAKDMDIAINAQLHSTRSGMAGNYGRYKSDKMDELILASKIISDSQARKESYNAVLELFAKDVPSVPLYYAKSSRAFSADLNVISNCAQYDRFYYYSWK